MCVQDPAFLFNGKEKKPFKNLSLKGLYNFKSHSQKHQGLEIFGTTNADYAFVVAF